jgi:hypothetical protein
MDNLGRQREVGFDGVLSFILYRCPECGGEHRRKIRSSRTSVIAVGN